MILVTVGSQLPFDRLVQTVDAWCAAGAPKDVFGQIGDPGPRGYRPAHFEWERFVDPNRFAVLFREADLIIAHAGMGSIISALMSMKPIVIMPRRAALGEHRNDHQMATAARYKDRPGIYVVGDEAQLADAVERALVLGATASTERLPAHADPRLIESIRRFILAGEAETDRNLPQQVHARQLPGASK